MFGLGSVSFQWKCSIKRKKIPLFFLFTFTAWCVYHLQGQTQRFSLKLCWCQFKFEHKKKKQQKNRMTVGYRLGSGATLSNSVRFRQKDAAPASSAATATHLKAQCPTHNTSWLDVQHKEQPIITKGCSYWQGEESGDARKRGKAVRFKSQPRDRLLWWQACPFFFSICKKGSQIQWDLKYVTRFPPLSTLIDINRVWPHKRELNTSHIWCHVVVFFLFSQIKSNLLNRPLKVSKLLWLHMTHIHISVGWVALHW